MTVTISSKRTVIKTLERKTRREWYYVLTRTRGSSSQIWHEVKSIEVRQTLKCSCLRNGVVWGSSLMHSPLFVFLNLNVLIVDSKREWTATQAAVWWWWWWLLKRVKRTFVLCECQFWFSGNTNTLFWWCSKGWDSEWRKAKLVRPTKCRRLNSMRVNWLWSNLRFIQIMSNHARMSTVNMIKRGR